MKKTEILLISSPHFKNNMEVDEILVDDTSIVPSSSACNIGIVFDDVMCMNKQVSAICTSANYHLRNIGRIHRHITYKACEQLIHAFITTRLDCGNAVLFGMSDIQLNHLQRILNSAARI